MKYYVYLIKYLDKVMYVGKTQDFKKRKHMHLNCADTYKSAIPVNINLNEITFVQIETYDNEADALRKEDELIQEYDTINNGWNKQRSGLISIDKTAYQKEYRQKPEAKEKRRKYHLSQEYKEKDKLRSQTPERKAYMREYMRKYNLKKQQQNNQ